MMLRTIVGLGEALWDVLPSGKHLGGAPLNFVYITSLLGNHALIATRVGNDDLGMEIKNELSRRNLDLSGLQWDGELPTGTVNVTLQNGQPQYEICQPVAWDALEWSLKWSEIAAKCDAVCFGTLAQRAPKSRETILNFVQNTRRECLRVFDINLRKPFISREIIKSSLRLTTILKMNDAELPEIAAMFELTGGTLQEKMQQLLRKFDLKFVFVTRGEHGAAAISGTEFAEDSGFLVKVHDTIGAGDAFTAAATHGILSGMELKETLQIANRWASWVASQPGGMPPIGDELRRGMLFETALRTP